MWWYLVIFIIGIVGGLLIEQKWDLLKPKHIRRIEEEVSKLRAEVRTWLESLK